jgi:hypothetical protein
MDPETVESTCSSAATAAAETASLPDHDPPLSREEAEADARRLVACLIEAGQWPEPKLLEQIVATGDAATEPLIGVLRSRPRGWRAEAVLDPVIGLLRMLRPPAAIPALIEILKCYNEEVAECAADALVDFGTPGFEALIELCNDPSIRAYSRNFVFEAAVYAAGHDPAKRSRLADVLRPILEERIAKAREELRAKGWLAKLPPRDEFLDEDDEELDDDFDEEGEYEDEDEEVYLDEEFNVIDEVDDDAIDQEFVDHVEDSGAITVLADSRSSADESEPGDSDQGNEEVEPEIAEELAYVVGALADLGDPVARDAITTAFEEGLVDEAVVDQDEVECGYEYFSQRKVLEPATDWLSIYREDYEAHLESLNPPCTPPRIYVPPPRYGIVSPPYEPDDLEPVQDTAVTPPIRNTGPKLGRNDPCWCGSGQKYKKCHLGQDTLAEPD